MNLKLYVKPAVSFVELKTEERLAASVCKCCGMDETGEIIVDNVWHH